MANFKKGIVSLVLSTGILLGGCANVREGEIIAKEYEPPKKGTPLFGFTSPAVFTASLVLKAATMRSERFDNYVERYDFVQGKLISDRVNNRFIYHNSEVGDWMIRTFDERQYKQIKNFSKSIDYPVGTKLEIRK